ncbi:histidine kinase CKI1 [Senna tora]|uniref:histidine kinase n=1 Tax=Senna tora TaxID=362788 RepID=A0A834W0Q6_9FABA|nr:histidine kinase CKI1 [Senna tora]
MSSCLSMLFRPSSIVILLGSAALIVAIVLTPCWYFTLKHIEHHVNLNSQVSLFKLQSEIEDSAKLLQPLNSSSINIARLLSSNLSTNISFSEIQTKVAPVMFQAFETNPHLAEISFSGMEGLFFSYYTDHHRAYFAMYSNSSSSNETLYYIQRVNRDTGKLYGEAITSNVGRPSVNTSWIDEQVNSSYGSYASVGTMRSNGGKLLFISSVRITGGGAGVVSLGFPTKFIGDFIKRTIGGQGSSLMCLATKDGKVLVQGIQRTRMVFSNDMVTFRSLNPQTYYEVTVSCKDKVVASIWKTMDTQYLLYCSSIDIMGVHSVYVLAIPQNGLVHFVEKSRKEGLKLLIVVMVMMIFSFLSSVITLIKQMKATQEADRRMNKSLALASASHEIRNSLANLTGLIHMSYDEVVPASELDTHLKQMDFCTKDLLGLLNSILDLSKIEAGKMQLEEEEFDLSQLIEDVVDLYHPLAMEKGVDLILDPCDVSVVRYSSVKGDRGKLKQVLLNLLSNAVKFTDEGHIVVRAWGQKPSFHNSVTSASNRHSRFMNHLSYLFCKENKDPEAVTAIQQDVNCMDFVLEVEDTGRGIPKEKHKSVFENYVQVKETALGQVGTGLGLRIVQSLVRLMQGDIAIMDKDMEEKGTCFKFNVLLTILTPGRSPSPRPEGLCVVLLIQYEERRRTLQKFMESVGIEVNVVKQWEHLFDTLERIKQKRSNSTQSSLDLSGVDGIDDTGFIMIVIDANAGPFVELCRMVCEFRRGLHSACKVVWLNKPRSDNLRALDIEDMLDPEDIVISKPFHGTRLFQVLKLLPEHRQLDSSRGRAIRETNVPQFQSVEQFRKESSRDSAIDKDEIRECGDSNFDNALSGKKILLVEDSELTGKVAMHALRRLGATVEPCENGEEAVKLVENGLTRAFLNFPYDYILMDCEMPVMDGFEATRRIRAMQNKYGVRIPIIALSGPSWLDLANRTQSTADTNIQLEVGTENESEMGGSKGTGSRHRSAAATITFLLDEFPEAGSSPSEYLTDPTYPLVRGCSLMSYYFHYSQPYGACVYLEVESASLR